MKTTPDPKREKDRADAAAATAAFLAGGGKIKAAAHGETGIVTAKKLTQADRARGHTAVMQKLGKPVNLARKRKYPMESL